MQNLDFLAAKYGQLISGSNIENVVTTALDILNLQGVYAMFLWLHEKEERSIVGEKINEMLHSQQSPIPIPNNVDIFSGDDAMLFHVREQLTSNIKIMFFAKELINQTLIYARHHAKAGG
jgi:hypothetical protein